MELLTALADPARWRLVTLLAERPRPVGVLAELAGARQPQTTKHLQTLERAGVVESQRSGARRVYALRAAALREVAGALTALADAADSSDARATFERYGRSLADERVAAVADGWADGRSFTFTRTLAADPALVWRHLTEAPLLAAWWTPDDLRVSELVFEARPGGRIVHEYRDAEDAGRADAVVGRALGEVEAVLPTTRLAYRLSPLLPGGGAAFTAHVGLDLSPRGGPDGVGAGTELRATFRVSDSTVGSADFVAGIEIGFGQSLDTLVATLAPAAQPTETETDTETDTDTGSQP